MVHGCIPVYLGIGDGFNPEAIPENLAYVIDGAGWKIWKRNGISRALIPVETVSGLAVAETGITFTASKIPADLFRRVTAWFSAVYQKHRSEAVGYLYYRLADGAWDFVVPSQAVGSAHAKYDAAPRREGWQCAGTVHSHAAMGAFHSGVDDADEASFDGVHITVGRLDSIPEYSCSLVVQGVRVKVELSDLVAGVAPCDVPAEWLDAIKKSAPVGFDGALATEAQALYRQYYAGELPEADYEVQLGALEERQRAARATVLAINSRPWEDRNHPFFGKAKAKPPRGGKSWGTKT